MFPCVAARRRVLFWEKAHGQPLTANQSVGLEPWGMANRERAAKECRVTPGQTALGVLSTGPVPVNRQRVSEGRCSDHKDQARGWKGSWSQQGICPLAAGPNVLNFPG